VHVTTPGGILILLVTHLMACFHAARIKDTGYAHTLCKTCPKRVRDEHGSGLKPILTGSGLDGTAIFLKIGDQDWIGLRKYLLF